ncbi:MAG: DUF3043 domain-containing protein [Candidatus Aquiluna sp.]|nr:DUF3043 domain-containing protein [Aquiluna sp.]
MTQEDNTQAGKGRPTPSRKDRELARKRPLVGDRSKQAKSADKEKNRAERQKAREGMMAGEERYLGARDKGPQRKLARNVVDARFTAGELVLPMLFVVVLMTFIDSYAIQIVALFAMWGLFAVVAVDSYFVGRAVKKKLGDKLGAENLDGGLAWYGAMRSIQMRTLRIPKPQVARFTKLEL